MMCCNKSNIRYTTTVLILALTFVWSWILPVENARILAVETEPFKSSWNFMSSILRVLSDNGHHVTVFTPFIDGNRENYTEVDTSEELKQMVEMNLTDSLNTWGSPMLLLEHVRAYGRLHCDIIYGNVRLSKIMQEYKSSVFDIVIIEPFGHLCESYLATKLNLPMIYLFSSPMLTFAERSAIGHVPNPATVSHIFANHGTPKTFIDRLSNTALTVYSILLLNGDKWIKKYPDPKPYDFMSHPVKPSLLFLNSHFISESSRPFPPNVVQVGGIHLKPVKRLPNDILEFIENSPHGVILFTFGSTVKLSSSPEYITNAFKEALAEVPQRILWKYEIEMENKPTNVMTKKWFPQRDILAHPNVKLFISHGGLSGVYEAVDAGVPILGFPLFYDQPKNIANIVDAGMAISMDLISVQKDTILRNVLELVNNEKYAINAKIASDRLKDRPMSPQQSILYWTEYVIRHKGAPHLKSHALNLSWYEYFLLDVIAVVLICVLISLLIVCTFFKIIYNCILKCFRNLKVKSE